jgi:hypothetical protein
LQGSVEGVGAGFGVVDGCSTFQFSDGKWPLPVLATGQVIAVPPDTVVTSPAGMSSTGRFRRAATGT